MLGAVLLLGLLAFAGTLRGAFVYDDLKQIIRNEFIQENRYFWKAMTSDVWAFEGAHGGHKTGYWRPVFVLWLIVNERLFGTTNPAGWHASSLLAHLGAIAACWHLLLRRFRLDGVAAGLILALFAIHPVHVESVAWISGVTDPLATLLLIASWTFHLSGGKGARYVALGLFGLALLTKEFTVVLPALVFAGAWLLPPRRNAREAAQEAAPYAALTVLFLVVRFAVLGGGGSSGFPGQATPCPGDPVASGGGGLLPERVLLSRAPVADARSEGGRPRLDRDPELLASACRRRRVGLGALVGGPTGSGPPARAPPVPPASRPGHEDRRLHARADRPGPLPVPPDPRPPRRRGAVPGGAARRPAGRGEGGHRVAGLAGTGLAVLLALETAAYGHAWGDPASFWERALRGDPRSTIALVGHAQVLRDSGRTREALEAVERAIAISPAVKAYELRGQLLFDVGRTEEGEKDLLVAAEAERVSSAPYERLAIEYQKQGRLDQAGRILRLGRERLPDRFAALTDSLAVVLYMQGRKDEALRELEAVRERALVETGSLGAKVLLHLGSLHAEAGRVVEARRDLEDFLRRTERLQAEPQVVEDRGQARKVLAGLPGGSR